MNVVQGYTMSHENMYRKNLWYMAYTKITNGNKSM